MPPAEVGEQPDSSGGGSDAGSSDASSSGAGTAAGGSGSGAAPGGSGAGRRRTRLVVGLAVLLAAGGILAAVALSGSGGGSGGGLVGHVAPAFSVDQLTGGGKVSLASAGGRPLVLNFWASWCDPCKQEMPAFEAEHRVLGDRVVFLGIDTKDNHDDGVAFLQKVGVDYLAGFDLLGATADKYGLIGMPTTFLIRPDGQVVYRHTGGLSQATLDGLVRRYFG